MSPRARRVGLLAGLGAVLGVLLWGYTGLPAFASRMARYGLVIDRVAERQRHLTNFPSAVMFDYRGVDTMIEEFILFTSVMGLALLLRSSREEAEEAPFDVVTSEVLRGAGRFLAPVLLLFGLWVIAFGYITPGGGFQGGVVASGGALLLWVTGSYRRLKRSSPTTLVDGAEGLGAAAFVGIGLVGLAAGGTFLYNTIPLGTAGTLASAGTVAALNWVSGTEVAAAFVLIYHEFSEEYVYTLPRES